MHVIIEKENILFLVVKGNKRKNLAAVKKQITSLFANLTGRQANRDQQCCGRENEGTTD